MAVTKVDPVTMIMQEVEFLYGYFLTFSNAKLLAA
jgi:hypothetical protein